MISKRIDVSMYNFRVDLIEIEGKNDVPSLLRLFKSVKLNVDLVEEVIESIKDGDVDGGWTFCNFGIKRVLVVLLPMRSVDKRREVLSHEKRHVEDDILRHCGIDDSEAAGYLAGYLGKFMY